MQHEVAAAIETQDILKSYGSRRVLDQVSFAIPKNSIVGLLGANGAGKTTLLRILLGLLPADKGTARLLGAASSSLPPETRARVGYVPQISELFGWLTGGTMLRYVGSFYPNYDADFAQDLAARLQVSLKTLISALSPGQQQRLSFVRAMSTRPDLLILDEPMAALDPAARLSVIEELVRAHAQRDLTIVVSSHLIHDLERYCTHLGVMENGRMAAFDTMAHFVGLARVLVRGDEALLRAQNFPGARRIRVSGTGERSLVIPRDQAHAIESALPTGLVLQAAPSDLEAVMSEWMR